MPDFSRGALTPLALLLILSAFSAPGSARAAEATPEELEARFAEAYEALNAERVYTAKKLLSDLVDEYPTLLRARLELARAEYLSRDLDAAETQVLEVLEEPELPASVRTTLLAFLAQIRDDQQDLADRHSWSADVYGGVMYDSNVNFGVSRDILDLGGGLQLALADELSDWAGVLDAGVQHTYNPNKTFQSGESTGYFLWQTQANGYYRAYLGNDEFTGPIAGSPTVVTDDFNLAVATLRTGPAWVVPGKWSAGIGLQADQVFLGGEDLVFITSINPNANWQLNDRTALSAGLTYGHSNYQDSPNGRDGDLWRAETAISRLVADNRVNLEAGIGYSDYDADDSRFSFRSPDIFVGATAQAWERGQVFGRLGFRKFNYDGAELPPFQFPRNEEEWRVSAGFRHQIASTVLAGWALRGEWVFTSNNSNNPIFDFERHQLSLGLERSF